LCVIKQIKMKKIILFTVLAVCVVISACHKDQPEMNTDVQNPCDLTHEVSAEFTMEEYMSIFTDKLSETDSMYSGANLLFTAMDSTANYTWYIGTEVLTERSFVRNFDASLIGQTLSIHLVVKKNPNLICHPNDDGYDSITKYITVVDPGNQYVDTNYRIEGVYRMKDINSNDSVDIILDMNNSYVYPPTNVNWGQVFVFKNVNGLGLELPFEEEGNTYRQIWFEPNGLGFNYDCYLKLKKPSNIEIKLGAHDGYPSYHLFGRKIN